MEVSRTKLQQIVADFVAGPSFPQLDQYVGMPSDPEVARHCRI
jgi:hypothetical protein